MVCPVYAQSLNDLRHAVKRFADGETSILVNDGVRGKRVYIVCSTTTVDRYACLFADGGVTH